MDESAIDGDTRAALDFIRALVDDRVIRRPMDYQATALAEFDVSTWFERDPAALEGHKFIQFGQDGTGSGYCLWYYPTLGDRRPRVACSHRLALLGDANPAVDRDRGLRANRVARRTTTATKRTTATMEDRQRDLGRCRAADPRRAAAHPQGALSGARLIGGRRPGSTRHRARCRCAARKPRPCR